MNEAAHLSRDHKGRRVENLTKDHVLPVQPVALGAREEELAAVRVGPAVRHRDR